MKKLINVSILAAFAIAVLSVAAFAQGSNCGATDYQCKVDANTKLITSNPKDAEAYYNRGIALKQLGEYADAIADLDTYILSNPQKDYLADGYSARGDCYKAQGKTAMALADYNKSIQAYPTTTALNNRGTMYFIQGDYEKAIADFTTAITIDPKDAEPYYNRAKAYSSQKLYAKAIADLDVYIGFNTSNIPFLADGYQNRSVAYSNINNLTKALADASKAVELDPTKARYTNRAIIYRKMGKEALAKADEASALPIIK